MNTTPICPSCGKLLDASAPKGLCPECLMKGAFHTGPDTGGKSPRFIPPKREELAPQFPQLEILEFIGQGGMGAVYKARQKQLDRVVALKILPPQAAIGEGFAERFAREARALAKLNHPHIVTLYEFGQSDGLFYFLMEFVDGINLRQLLNAGRIAPKEALAIVPQICDALQFAHERGIVHRDIKPENILLGKDGQVKIADFGVAKLMGQSADEKAAENPPGSQPGELTGAGGILGTPQYMAPEQVAHPLDVDHRADIYSLGVVFYQMLTGELPGKRIEPPSRKVQIDVRLDEVVMRALEKAPELRFQQASIFKTQVETIATTPVEHSYKTSASSVPAAGGPSDFVSMPLNFLSRLAMLFACAGGVLGTLAFCFWPSPPQGLVWSIPLAALFGIFFAIFAWKSQLGKTAFVVGCVNLSIWLAIFIVTSNQTDSTHQTDVRIVMPQRLHSAAAATKSDEQPLTAANAPQLMQDGWQLWKAGEFVEATARFQKAVQLIPDNPDAWNGLGWAQFNSGKNDDARHAFQKAVALDAHHPAALNGLGQILLSERNYNEAEKFLLEAAPRATAAWYGLARLYLLQGEFDQAEKWAQNIVDSGQGDETAPKMLEAAKSKHLSDGLRMILEPPAMNAPPSESVQIQADSVDFDTKTHTVTARGNPIRVVQTRSNTASSNHGRELGLLGSWMELQSFLPNQYWNLSMSTNRDCQMFHRAYFGLGGAEVLLCIDDSEHLQVSWLWDKRPDSNALASAEAELQKLKHDATAFYELMHADAPVSFEPFKRASRGRTPAAADYTNALAVLNLLQTQLIPCYIAMQQHDLKLSQIMAPAIAKEMHNYNQLVHGTDLEFPDLDMMDKITAAIVAGNMAKADELTAKLQESNQTKSTDVNELAEKIKAELQKTNSK